jgi:hypothetical protein
VTLVAVLHGYDDEKVEIDLSGAAQEVTLKLTPKPALYSLKVDPRAHVKVTGEGAVLTGQGDRRTVEVRRPDGKHDVTVTASLAGHHEDEQQLRPQPGETKVLSLRPKPKPAVFTIEVEPAEAAVRVTGQGTRVTGEGRRREVVVDSPQEGLAVRVTATHDGYEPLSQNVTGGPGSSQSLKFRLKRSTVWRTLPDTDYASRMIVWVDRDGTITTGAPGMVFSSVVGSREANADFDPPGSIWFMAEGGSRGERHRGTELAEGKIYRFDSKRKPIPTDEDEYSVWISFEREAMVYEKKVVDQVPLARIPVGQRARLLLASKDLKNGWHRIRTTEGLEGWVQGKNWKDTVFMAKEPPSPK